MNWAKGVVREFESEDTTMYDALKQEFEYYVEHQKELVEQYNGKFVVIKDKAVIGAYDDEVVAINETVKKHELGTFLVQKCEPGTDNYTQTIIRR